MVISYSFPSFHPHVPFYFLFFFSWFFLHHTRIPLSPPTLLFLFLFLDHSGSLVWQPPEQEHISTSPSLFLFLSFSFSYTNTQISLPLSHTNKFSLIHTQITGREVEIGVLHRSKFYIFVCLFWFDQFYFIVQISLGL